MSFTINNSEDHVCILSPTISKGFIRKSKLSKDYPSLQSVLDEMRPIRYIEHPNTKPVITPFVGDQVKICEAFEFEIPDGCAPEYVVRKTNKGKRGRPRKNKLVVKEEN